MESFRALKERAAHSAVVQSRLRDGTFWQDEELVAEMMDDTPLKEEGMALD